MIVLKRLHNLAHSHAAGKYLFYAFSSTKPIIDKLSDAGEQAVWAN